MNAGGEGRPRWRPGPIPDTVLTFRDLTYTIKKNVFSTRGRPRQVLRGVSAHIPSSMFAVLGPSGAGKSTMLDIIAGRKSTAGGSWSGRVAINGVVLKPEELRQCVGCVVHGCGDMGRHRRLTLFDAALRRYVTQDDVALGTQSVREYLLWQTRMRLPQSLTRKQRHERVRWLFPATTVCVSVCVCVCVSVCLPPVGLTPCPRRRSTTSLPKWTSRALRRVRSATRLCVACLAVRSDA